MKKIALFVSGFLALAYFMASLCHSEDRVYTGNLVNEKISASKNYDLKLDTIDDLSMVAVYSSATLNTSTITSASVDYTTSRFTIPSHGYGTGTALLFTTTGTAPAGLTTATTYYALPVTANTIELSSSAVLAAAGSYIVISSSGSGGDFYFSPLAFTGTYSFKFQGSNDGVNYFDVVSASSVTYSAPGTTEWDGPIYFRWLRCAVTAGTGGALNLLVTGNGKRKS